MGSGAGRSSTGAGQRGIDALRDARFITLEHEIGLHAFGEAGVVVDDQDVGIAHKTASRDVLSEAAAGTSFEVKVMRTQVPRAPGVFSAASRSSMPPPLISVSRRFERMSLRRSARRRAWVSRPAGRA